MSYTDQSPANSGTPLPPDVDVKAVANGLDAALQAAIAQGNQAVIAAVQAGATTTQQVVETMIRLGLTTGLPPGVQQLVDERKEQMEKQREADNKALLGTAAGVVGAAALWGSSWNDKGSGNAENTGQASKQTNGLDPATFAMGMDLIRNMTDYGAMNAQQKEAYLKTVGAQTFETWGQTPPAQQAKMVENVATALHTELSKTPENREQLLSAMREDTVYGQDAAERKRTVEQIEANQKAALQEAMQAKGLTKEGVNNLGIKEREALYKDADQRFENKNEKDFGSNPELLKAANMQGRQLMGNDKRDDDLTYLSRNQDKIKSKDPETLALYETYTTTKSGAEGASASAHDDKKSLEIVKEKTNENNQAYQTGNKAEADADARKMDKGGAVENLEWSSEKEHEKTVRDNLAAREDSYLGGDAGSQPRLSIDATPLTQSPLAQLGEAPEVAATPATLNPQPAPQRPQPAVQGPGGSA